MYKYLLFDLDGTLTDPKQGITGCVQYALHKMGIEEPDADKLTPFIGPPLLDSFHEFYGFSEKQGWQATEYYRERFRAVGWHENVMRGRNWRWLRANHRSLWSRFWSILGFAPILM